MCMWTKCHDTLVKVRGQLERVCSFLLSCGFQGLNSQYQGWQHMPFLLSFSTSSCLPPPVYIHVIRNCILCYRNCNVAHIQRTEWPRRLSYSPLLFRKSRSSWGLFSVVMPHFFCPWHNMAECCFSMSQETHWSILLLSLLQLMMLFCDF